MKDTIIFKINSETKKQLVKEAKSKDMTLTAYLKSMIEKRKK